MRVDALLIGVLLLVQALGAVPDVRAQAGAAPGGSVQGVAVDARGRPIEGARVWLNPDGIYGRTEVVTDSAGRYSIGDLLRVPYRALAFVDLEYQGESYCFRLASENPNDYSSFSPQPGLTRNFVLRFTGPAGRDRGAYHGATIRLANTFFYVANHRALELTLTPTAPPIDGSAGEAIRREIRLDRPAREHALRDLPIGLYKLTGVRIGKAGERAPLTFQDNVGRRAATIDIKWQSSNRCAFGENSGTRPVLVMLARP
jgi:hypothetical protein